MDHGAQRERGTNHITGTKLLYYCFKGVILKELFAELISTNEAERAFMEKNHFPRWFFSIHTPRHTPVQPF
jgi:hypothetical protein